LAVRRVAIASLAVGAGVTWNMSSVGSVADPVAEAYGVSLAFVGLLTTALLLSQLLAQLPTGREIDRRGWRAAALAAVGLCLAGNAIAVLAPSPWLGLLGRLVTGLGSGAGFVAGADAMRSTGLSMTWQGTYGAATMAGGGLAVLITPQLVGELGWRAPYWSGIVVAALTAIPLLLAPRPTPVGGHRRGFLVDRRLVPLGVIHSATFALTFIAAAWVVPLLERHDLTRRDAAIAGALVLLGGITTRPLGGTLGARFPPHVRHIVAGAVVAASTGCLLLALEAGLVAAALAALLLGVAGGIPFALVFGGAQRLRPDAPGAALAFVNSWAVLTLMVGTPLVGLGFALPGGGSTAFALLGLAALAALPAVRHAPLAGTRDAQRGNGDTAQITTARREPWP
jgi:DHA1 family inner membrane transport protein